MGVQINCDECGKEFEEYPCHIEEDKKNFCSNDCQAQFQSNNWVGEDNPRWDGGKETVACEECGREYKVPSCEVEDSQFCSRSCVNKDWMVEAKNRECDECGTSFKRKSCNIKGDHVFCSDSCYRSWISDRYDGEGNPMYIHGNHTHSYGENWPEQRRKAITRDEYTCQSCGMTRDEHYEKTGRDLEIHHKIPISKFDEAEDANYLSNLITLCRSCHPHASEHPLSYTEFVSADGEWLTVV